MTYIIVDEFGNQIGGVSTSESKIAAWAQEKADERGSSVWYTTSEEFDECDDLVEVEPSA